MIKLVVGNKTRVSIELGFNAGNWRPYYIRPATGESGFRKFGLLGVSVEISWVRLVDYKYKSTDGMTIIFGTGALPHKDAFEIGGKRFELVKESA
jgi:hypothetical protein